MLTKYEPVGTHDDPVYNSFCVSVGDPVGLNPVKNLVFYSLFGAGRGDDCNRTTLVMMADSWARVKAAACLRLAYLFFGVWGAKKQGCPS